MQRLGGGVSGGHVDASSAAAATHLLPPGVAGLGGEPEETSQQSPALEHVLEAGRRLEQLQREMAGEGGAAGAHGPGFRPSAGAKGRRRPGGQRAGGWDGSFTG